MLMYVLVQLSFKNLLLLRMLKNMECYHLLDEAKTSKALLHLGMGFYAL